MTQNNTGLPILIAGAGLSGICLAALFTAQQVPFLLLESCPQHGDSLTQAFSLHHWAHEGLARTIAEQGDLQATIEDLKGWVAVHHQSDAREQSPGIFSGSATHGPSGLDTGSEAGSCLRANFARTREWLLRRIRSSNILWSSEIVDAKPAASSVVVSAKGAGYIRGRLLIAADGARSIVRSTLLPEAIPRPLPVVAYQWRLPLSSAEYDHALEPYFRNASEIQSGHRGVNVWAGIDEINESAVAMSGLLSRACDPCKEQQISSDVLSVTEHLQQELQPLGPLSPPFSILLEKACSGTCNLTRPDVLALNIKTWELEGLAAKGVVLFGDAAHAIPFLAEEAESHCLLDAVELAAALRDQDAEVQAPAQQFYDGAVERRYHAGKASEQALE